MSHRRVIHRDFDGCINAHWALVKSFGHDYRASVETSTQAAYRFACDVADAMDSLGNAGIAADQDAHDQWDAEAREIEAVFKGETL